MATKQADKGAGEATYRIVPGGAWSNAWKIAAGVGVLGLGLSAMGFASDSARFAYSYLFGFFVFLTIGLGSLFFLLMQHLTGAHWSVTVRRTAEFFASGLPAFVLLVVPVLALGGSLYSWQSHGHHGEHGDHGEHGAGGEHGGHSSLTNILERSAHAQPTSPATADEPRHGADPTATPPGHQEPQDHTRLTPQGSAAPGAVESHGFELSDAPGDDALKGATPRGAIMTDPALRAALERAEANEHARVLAKKTPYLNKPFWLIRGIFCVLVWAWLGMRYFRLSTEQDKTKKLENTAAAQRFAPIAAILFALTLTIGGVDWLMGLDPLWFSTMWGVYVFAGSVVAMFAVLILTTLSLRSAGLLGNSVTVEHYHDLGKLQFGFLVFWAYIAFSQFFLIWYSNIPEEVAFYHRRWTDGGGTWQGISIALVLVHFVVPFALLLSRNTKRKLGVLALGATIILAMHVVELYWIILPNYGDGHLNPTLSDLGALLFVGGVYLAVVFKAMTSHPLVPVGDPRLARSLHHST
jgi:hypothetical protein